MLTPDDFVPPEVIDLEEEADARGYFASDEDDPGGEGSQAGATRLLAVRSRRR
jgi:hypothetical protein